METAPVSFYKKQIKTYKMAKFIKTYVNKRVSYLFLSMLVLSYVVMESNFSNQSFWPIILAITNLPPGIRMNAENLILAGVWQGTGKQPMKVILSKVLVKINQLYSKGVHIQSSR